MGEHLSTSAAAEAARKDAVGMFDDIVSEGPPSAAQIAALRRLESGPFPFRDISGDRSDYIPQSWRSRLFGTECRVFILPQGLRIVRWFPR